MRLRRWLVCGLLLALLPAQLVLAHPKIIRTDPPADAQLLTAPTEVRIEFNEAIEQSFAELHVFNAQGQLVDQGDSGRSAENPAFLRVSLTPLPAGIYTVVWQVVGSDGHQVKGFFAFRVLGPASGQAQATLAPDSQPAPTAAVATQPLPVPVAQPEPLPLWAALLRACMLLGTLIALGGWAFAGLILAPVASAQPLLYQTVLVRIRRLLIGGVMLVLLTAPLFLLAHTSTIAEQVDLPSLWLTLTTTRLGQALLGRAVLSVLLLIMLVWRAEIDRLFVPALVLGGMVLLSFAISGHASVGASPLVPILLDWLHLVATTLWIGGLVTFVLVLPLLATLLGPLLLRFSRMALGCVMALTASGVATASLRLTDVSDLWTSAYGQALSIKLLLFGVLIAFGAYHLLVIRPQTITRMDRAGAVILNWQQRFQASLRIEALVAIGLIGSVGLLTSLPLPEAQLATAAPIPSATLEALAQATALPLPTRTPAPVVPFVGEQSAADLRVGLRVEPAALGANTLTVTVMDANGQPRDVQRVQLALEMMAMDMGETSVITEPAGIGTYQANAQWLSMVGTWHIQVLVRRSDAEDVIVTFMVPVGG